MVDRQSRPHRSPNRTPTRTERRIINVRVIAGGDRPGSGTCWACIPRRCTGCLTRYGLAKLRWLDRADRAGDPPHGAARCGDLVHVDVKKLGKIPAGGGWRMLGRRRQPQLLGRQEQRE